MRESPWIFIAILIVVTGSWAGLTPFQVAEETATPIDQDSVALYEVIVRSNEDGKLEWFFRLEGSPSEDITVWVGFPGAGRLLAEGIPDAEPTSMVVNCLLPGMVKSSPLTLYQIDFPGDKITLMTLKTTTPNPWSIIEGGVAGQVETWAATVGIQGLAMWSGLVRRAKILIDLPEEMRPVWNDDPGKFQSTASSSHETVEGGSILWEFRNWEPQDDLSIHVSVYRPVTTEMELLDPPRIMLPEQYFGDQVAYGDSIMNGYMWMPEFRMLSEPRERGVYARAYLYVRQNEILARHGFKFEGEETLKSYFEKQPWYKPDPKFKAEMLSEIEMMNFWKLINRRAEFRPQFRDERE